MRGAADSAVDALSRLDRDDWHHEVGIGADGAPTSTADAVAEAAAIDRLMSGVPDAAICSEEAGLVGGGGDTLIILDPVDGTNNAIRGIPYWAVSIGVLRDGDPVAGLVRNVPSKQDHLVIVGEGAWRDGNPARPVTVASLGASTVAIQRSATADAAARATNLMMSVTTARVLGSAALDLVGVGSGQFHAYANVNTDLSKGYGEKVVDYAAAAIFSLYVGAVVTDASGRQVPFEPDLSRRVPIVAAANRALHDELLSLLAAT